MNSSGIGTWVFITAAGLDMPRCPIMAAAAIFWLWTHPDGHRMKHYYLLPAGHPNFSSPKGLISGRALLLL